MFQSNHLEFKQPWVGWVASSKENTPYVKSFLNIESGSEDTPSLEQIISKGSEKKKARSNNTQTRGQQSTSQNIDYVFEVIRAGETKEKSLSAIFSIS